MQHDVQVTRRKFVTRLTVLAASSIALTTVAGVLTGCGGGGGVGVATPTPGSAPTLPVLATVNPQTPAQGATTIQTQFGLPTVVGAQVGAPLTNANVGSTVQQAFTLDNFLIPTYTTGADGFGTKLTLQTARQAGLTQADLDGIIQTLLTAKETFIGPTVAGKQQFVSSPIISAGDRLGTINFTFNGQTYSTPNFVHANGSEGYNSVLFALPGISEVRTLPSTQAQTNQLPNSGSTVETVVTNRNPIDGHIHYDFALSANASFNRQTGDATLANPQAVVDQLGPFVSVPTGPSTPTITNVAAGAPSHLLQSSATFEFKYAQKIVWEIRAILKLLLHNKTVTGPTGGSA